LRWLAWLLFLTPIVMFAAARGWQGGRCWAVRYVTPGIVALLALALPQAEPWRRWPRAFWVALAAGLFVNATSVVAPVRGMLQLSAQAVAAETARAVASGRTSAVKAAKIDTADLTGWHPRYSPLFANWRYALASIRGDFEDEAQRRRDGGPHTIEALFGVAPFAAEHGLAPVRFEDRRGRHIWWRFWSDLCGVRGWLLALPCVLLALLAARRSWWPCLRASANSTAG
jgi:hypothetical protein